uniref:Uncharacterized protein n=1 Tax=Mola mola TaxID=94237 RepID=A0A3Q3WPS2_MOLML
MFVICWYMSAHMEFSCVCRGVVLPYLLSLYTCNRLGKLYKHTTCSSLVYLRCLSSHIIPCLTLLHTCSFTAMSQGVLAAIIITSLSIAAVVISGAIYGCYLKLKAMWWDTVGKCPNPKLLDMHPSKHEDFFATSLAVSLTISFVFRLKESQGDTSGGSPQQSSGISTGSSCLSYANAEPIDIIAGVQDALGKAFANISPISPLTTSPLAEFNKNNGLFSSPSNLCGVKPDDINSGSSSFDNRTYSILIPSLPQHIKEEVSEVRTTAELPCDSAYHPSEGDIVFCADQQLPACPLFTSPPVVPSLLATDMSYQQCNADSVRFLHAEDSSLPSVSSGSGTSSCNLVSGVEAGCECSDEVYGDATKLNVKVEKANVCDDNPCYGCVPAGSSSFPPVEDDYQAFQSLLENPDVLFSDQQSGEKKEHLLKYPEESFTKMPEAVSNSVVPGFTKNVQDGSVSLPVQPFLSLLSAVQSLPEITDSAYQSV